MKKTISILSVLLLVACGGAKVMSVSESDLTRIQANNPEASMAELQEGQSLFERYCQDCHAAAKSYGISKEAIDKVVPAMVNKVNKKAGAQAIDVPGKDKIIQYLYAINGRE